MEESHTIDYGIGFGLSLSGGGFRALLFHLGVVRSLYDLGLLKDVRHIIGVSGGSILAAHLVLHWDEYTGSPAQFDLVSSEIVRFVQQDVRGAVTRRTVLGFGIPSTSRMFQRRLSGLFGHLSLKHMRKTEVVSRPGVEILSTNYTQGTLTSFSSEGIALNALEEPPKIHCAGHLPIALAVAASTAYPPFFSPVRIGRNDLSVKNAEWTSPSQLFVDGGVYDNSGCRVLSARVRTAGLTPIVSDAGSEMDWNLSRFSVTRGSLRAVEILMGRVAELEFEAFSNRVDKGVWLSIRSEDHEAVVDLKRRDDEIPWEIAKLLPQVRTDLDRFSELEVDILSRHGYAVATDGLRGFWRSPVDGSKNWTPVSAARLQSHGAENESRARSSMARSSHRRLRLFSMSDWVSYVQLVVVVGILGLAWAILRHSSGQDVTNWTTVSQVADCEIQTELGELFRDPSLRLDDALRRSMAIFRLSKPITGDTTTTWKNRISHHVTVFVQSGDSALVKVMLFDVPAGATSFCPKSRTVLESDPADDQPYSWGMVIGRDQRFTLKTTNGKPGELVSWPIAPEDEGQYFLCAALYQDEPVMAKTTQASELSRGFGGVETDDLARSADTVTYIIAGDVDSVGFNQILGVPRQSGDSLWNMQVERHVHDGRTLLDPNHLVLISNALDSLGAHVDRRGRSKMSLAAAAWRAALEGSSGWGGIRMYDLDRDVWLTFAGSLSAKHVGE